MKRVAVFTLFTLLLLPQILCGEGLKAGHYRFTAPLGPLCLDGAYPFIIGDIPGGVLTVTTSPTGKLTGEIELWGRKRPVTGRIKSRPGYVRLTLTGKGAGTLLTINARLKGGNFVGKAVTERGTASCSMDVTASAPLAGVFDFNLAPNSEGRLRGVGTLTACGQELPITARASTPREQKSMLRLGTDKQWWEGAGLDIEGGFVAKWKAQGFGALTKGSGLKILAD